MPKLVDLTGMKFGRWRVLALHPERNRYGHVLWLCRCGCIDGTERIVRADALRNGRSTNCGCFRLETLIKRSVTHGMSETRVYWIWRGMLKRCFNPNRKIYRYYGARGITVCARWLVFENFYADMRDPPPGMSLDRIDVNGNYEPSNCRWATRAQQLANRRPYTKQKARRSTLAEIRAFADALARAGTAS